MWSRAKPASALRKSYYRRFDKDTGQLENKTPIEPKSTSSGGGSALDSRVLSHRLDNPLHRRPC